MNAQEEALATFLFSEKYRKLLYRTILSRTLTASPYNAELHLHVVRAMDKAFPGIAISCKGDQA